MSLTLKTEGDFEQLAKGQYEAVCFRIVDMGTTEQQYKDGPLTKKKVCTSVLKCQSKR